MTATEKAINELKKYTSGKKNTEKTEISVLVLNRVISALEQEPTIIGEKVGSKSDEAKELIKKINDEVPKRQYDERDEFFALGMKRAIEIVQEYYEVDE